MTIIEKRWEVMPRVTPQAEQGLERFPPVLRQILFNRGFGDYERAAEFLRAKPSGEADPYLLTDMNVAVERITTAIDQGEKIVVYGDYDADGVTSTALMMQTLTALNATAEAYIPNRFDEGYGLNAEALSALCEAGTKLVITVDCGIRAVAEVKHANEIGLDIIITDHHNLGPELPPALAIVNAKREHDAYPDKNLAGVGTAYKLAEALLNRYENTQLKKEQLLDLVAVGTIADLVPLDGENRALVRAGLRQMKQPQRQGLLSLMNVASIRPSKINAGDIGFGIGPRLNAAGRLDSALAAYELLTTTDLRSAAVLAQELDNQNRERQQITRDMQELAEEIAFAGEEIPNLIFVAHPEFNPGVVGLAASRLMDTYYRPAIVAEQGEEFTRGSCRSIPEFHITDALDQCADLLTHHGGHAAAAGFTVPNENVPEFTARLKQLADEKLAGKDLRPVLSIDAEVRLSDLTHELLKHMAWLQPTGYGNREPVFLTRNAKVYKSRQVGRDGTHLKLTLTDGKNYLDAIAFRFGAMHRDLPTYIDLVYNFEENEFNGRVSLQLNIRDIKPA